MSLHLLAIAAALAVRHLPQWLVDLHHRGRVPAATRSTPVRCVYVALLYLAICVPSLLGLARGAGTSITATVFGLGAFGTGWSLGLTGLLTIRHYYAEDISICPGFKLVTTGIYGLIRHPIRLGLALEALGLTLMSGFYVLLPAWLAMAALQFVRSQQEDDFLREQLGDEAVQYQRRVSAVNLPLGIWRRLRAVMANPSTRGATRIGTPTGDGSAVAAAKRRSPV